MHIKVGTFNVLNLAREGERYYPDEKPYTAAEYDQKARWVAGQLDRMEAHVVGFQEVFHEEALRDVCDRSGQFPDGTVVAPGADGASGPRLGLASRLPIDEPVTTITDFPAGVDAEAESLALPVGTFSRPILRTRVVLDPEQGTTSTVFVAHLKSKRPIRDPQAPADDPREEALGKARALIRRAAEAAALRFLVLKEVIGNAQPVIVLGDLNDAARAVTTDIIMGDAPSRFWPRDPEERKAYWDRLLYSAYELTVRRSGRDVSFTHIFNGHYENLDHILVSQEFCERNPQRIAEVMTCGTSTIICSIASSATIAMVGPCPTMHNWSPRSAYCDVGRHHATRPHSRRVRASWKVVREDAADRPLVGRLGIPPAQARHEGGL